jgi:diguanylate cyclase (GGDEF)-like protein
MNFLQSFKKFYKHIIIFFLIFLFINEGLKLFFHQQEESYLTVQTQLLSSQYQTQYKYLKIMSHDIYTMYQENDSLIKCLAKADATTDSATRDKLRKKIYKMLRRRYKRLVHMGVKQLHFHLTNNISFLRMHAPQKYGDDLTNIRETVVYVNKHLVPVDSFEVGRVAHGFRFVYPLFDKNKKHIGSMEVSFSSQQIMSYMNDKFMIKKHFIVLKSEVDKKMSKSYIDTIYENAPENSAYYMQKDINNNKKVQKELKGILKKIKNSPDIVKKMKDAEAFSIASSSHFNAVVAIFLPIKSFVEKETTAYLIIYTESDYIDTLLVEYNYVKLMFFTVLLLLFIFSIYVSITQSKLEAMAHYDKLTKLPNRAFFYAELEIDIKRAQRNDENLALLFIDLDGFKAVNDTHGHDAGDELLLQVAKRLLLAVRGEDVVGRVGGDEFVVLLSEVRTQKDAILVARKIVDSISKPFILQNATVNIGASIGIATFPEHAADADALVKCADSAMYVAKNNGKNNYHLYDENEG